MTAKRLLRNLSGALVTSAALVGNFWTASAYSQDKLARYSVTQPGECNIANVIAAQYCDVCPPKPHAMEPKALRGIHDGMCDPQGGEPKWDQWRPIPWDIFAQGEYIGPPRTAHVPEYRIRVDDQFDFVYYITTEVNPTPYRLLPKDKIRITSSPTDEIKEEVEVQPDGTIVLPLKNPIMAANLTVTELKEKLQQLYDDVYVNPVFTVQPLATNAPLADLEKVVDVRAGNQGRTRTAKVSPDGTVQLPEIPNAYLVGLSLEEATREINSRYSQKFGRDVRVTVQLTQRAPRHAYVLGEVRTPGKVTLDGPTDLLQLLSMAGGPVNGGNSRQLVVFRRTDDWRLIATKLDIRGAALVGNRPSPADNIWIRDLDVVVVPKTPIQLTDDALELIFTRGVYRALPVFWAYNFPW